MWLLLSLLLGGFADGVRGRRTERENLASDGIAGGSAPTLFFSELPADGFELLDLEDAELDAAPALPT